MNATPAATAGPVLVIGTGLLGASIGLALSALDVPVQLRDASPAALALARDVGAGLPEPEGGTRPAVVVVAVPPDVTAGVVGSALHAFPQAVITDVASVKQTVLTELAAFGMDLSRYVGSHPMAGREQHGPAAATGDLFVGRPWVICAHEGASPEAVLTVRGLAADVGATPVSMPAAEHDQAVALVSHLPQLAASLVAARLVDAPEQALALAGQGLRDVTRIAASDPRMWSSIITGNAAAVRDALRGVRDDLDGLLSALDRAAEDGPLAIGALHGIAGVISAGNDGVARIPGKHGGAHSRYQRVEVLVPDQPGELGRLFSEIGEIGVNIEDFTMDHSLRRKAGMAVVSVLPTAAQTLEAGLAERGWRVVSS